MLADLLRAEVPRRLGEHLEQPAERWDWQATRVFAERPYSLAVRLPNLCRFALVCFALPLAMRRKLDAATFLREGDQPAAAELIERQARLLGQAQYPGVQHEWPSVAKLVEQVADLEERLLAESASW